MYLCVRVRVCVCVRKTFMRKERKMKLRRVKKKRRKRKHKLIHTDKARFVGHFAQIIELYDESANKTMMLKSKRNMGIASFWLLDEIQDQE